jgi:alpha-glucosidase (family GH31 glycosyl hydrolase)
MNKQLHAMGFETMISVWPRFVPEDRYYAMLREKGWLTIPGRRNAPGWAAVRPRRFRH